MTRNKLAAPLLGCALALGGSIFAAVPASAQSGQDLLRMLQQQAKQIEDLRHLVEQYQSQAQDAAIRAKAAQATATAASKKVEKAAAPAGDPIRVKWEPAPSIKSPDGNFEMNLRGRILVDGSFIDSNSGSIDATEFRAARLGIEGRAWKKIKYKFEADFAENKANLKDAYLEYDGDVKLIFGQSKTPNSLEEQTSSRYITLMERGSFTDAFGFARMIGITAKTGGKNYTFAGGIYRGSNGTDNENEGGVLAARATFSPVFGKTQVHLGTSFRYRDQGRDQSRLRYRQRPHAHLADRYINTGHIADSDVFWGLETAAIMGPLTVQGEWGWLKADLSNPAVGQTNPTFTGGYVDVSWYVTGESRAYNPKKGTFGRPKVKNPIQEDGLGALQLAARFDRVDLTDKTIFGGQQNTYILGANWWLNRNTRFMLNYSHSKVSQAFLVADNGPDGRNNIDTFGFRAQVDW